VCLYICRALLWMHQALLVCVYIYRALLWMPLPKEAFFFHLFTHCDVQSSRLTRGVEMCAPLHRAPHIYM